MQKSVLNNKIMIFLKIIGFFILFYLAKNSGINNQIFPFVYGIFFGLLWCNQNIFILCFTYLIASVILDLTIYGLIKSLIFITIILIAYGIHYKFKKPIKYLHVLIYSCLCIAPTLFINIYYLNANIYLQFVEFFIGLLYCFMCIKIFECICVRGITSRLTLLETICVCILIASIFCGVYPLVIYDVHLIKFFGALILLVLSYVSNMSCTLLVASCMGVGSLFYAFDPTYLCVFTFYGLTLSMFKTKNKYISCVSLIFTELLCGFFFKFYYSFDFFALLPLILALVIYLLLPYKNLDSFGNKFDETLSSITGASVINRNRELMYKRLCKLSDVFAEMNKVYRSMICGGEFNSSAKSLVVNELKIKVCYDCPNKTKCFRMYNEETMQVFNQLTEVAFEKGKINILDIPTLFAGKCEKLNQIVSTTNDLINQYKNYAGMVNNIDASKVLLAEQLYGVSNIMRELSLEVNAHVNFEKGKEKKIIDELTYNNVICSDAIVYEDKDKTMSVSLAIRKQDSQKSCITKIVSKVIGHKMEVCEEESSTRAGWQVLNLKSCPKFDCIFGVATKTKTGSVLSGDSYSILKINEGKYLFALCDGMGSGQKAEATSSTAVGLIENFYKAGFNKEIIISSVNKLLSLGKEESFSALDLCVVDVRDGIGDFIKMGAPESFVKRKDTTKIISLGALPLGIVQNTESKTETTYFSSGDKIIMCTDGITDGFKNIDDLTDFINNISFNNPQEIAERIIEKVLQLNSNVAKDDMTVIVAKIFER